MSLRVDLVRTERRRKGQSISSISPGNGSVINDVIQIWAFSTPPPHPCSPYVPVSQNYKPPSASPYLHDINYECTLTIIQWLLWLIKFQTSLVFISWPSVCNSRYASHGIVNKPSEYRTQESDVQRVSPKLRRPLFDWSLLRLDLKNEPQKNRWDSTKSAKRENCDKRAW